jgi:hypothetical protein
VASSSGSAASPERNGMTTAKKVCRAEMDVKCSTEDARGSSTARRTPRAT